MMIVVCIKLIKEMKLLIDGFASCSGKQFESKGIPCRHLLPYFNLMQVAFLPSQYILKIWTKAKYDIVVDNKGMEISDFQDKCN
ncbi:hypothetical protein ACOSQ2_009982 [Xanthoceras sorbifolium]